MIRGDVVVTIPNLHRSDIGVDLLKRILERAGVSRDEWLTIDLRSMAVRWPGLHLGSSGQEVRMSQVIAHIVVPEGLTGEQLMAMGEPGPCELIGGRIVPMSPTGGTHARIESALGVELTLFVRQAQLGGVLTGEVGIYTRRPPDRVRGADLAFLSRKRAPQGIRVHKVK